MINPVHMPVAKASRSKIRRNTKRMLNKEVLRRMRAEQRLARRVEGAVRRLDGIGR